MKWYGCVSGSFRTDLCDLEGDIWVSGPSCNIAYRVTSCLCGTWSWTPLWVEVSLRWQAHVQQAEWYQRGLACSVILLDISFDGCDLPPHLTPPTVSYCITSQKCDMQWRQSAKHYMASFIKCYPIVSISESWKDIFFSSFSTWQLNILPVHEYCSWILNRYAPQNAKMMISCL